MREVSRTRNAIVNAAAGSTMQILNVILGFVSRTLFITLLNADYVGVNSLYTNILTVLSFAELGVGSAIAFSLYKPIAEENQAQIQALMKFYRTAYWMIGSAIFILGLCVIPFMGLIIHEVPDVKENLTFIYVLFLLNTSSSYFFGYKKTLIIADQKDYLVQFYTRGFQFLQIVLQGIFLLLTRAYLSYLIIQILCTIGQNVAVSRKADRLYPYIRQKNGNVLSKQDRSSIFSNVKALFVYKFGSVILNGTDNILISSMISVSAVGMAANYTTLMNSVTNVIGVAVSSITATVGNLAVKGNKAQIKNVMHQLLMLCTWLYGFLTIGFFVLANDFVKLWIGERYLLSQGVVLAILFSLYINGVQYAAYTFRTTQGLFAQSKWVPLISAALNIFLSVWWGKESGLAGIFLATGVSRLCTTTVVDPWLVYKNNFGERPYGYYLKYALEALAVLLNGMIQWKLISLIPMGGWMGFLLKLFIICITCNLVFFAEFGWTKDFQGLMGHVLPKLRGRICKTINPGENGPA